MKPYVILHNAVSLDGRIDGFPVDLAMYYGLIPRWSEDATLVGSGTVLRIAGDPAVPVDDESAPSARTEAADDRRPLLVIPDSLGRVKIWNFMLSQPYWRRGVALVPRSASADRLESLERLGIDRIVSGDGKVDLPAALEELNVRYGVKTVRADSGGTLNALLLRQGLVDEMSLLVHPCLVGRTEVPTFFRPADPGVREELLGFRLKHMEKLDKDVLWLIYEKSPVS